MVTKKILITGGTGSLGNILLDHLLLSKEYSEIVIFSRDEIKQFQLQLKYKNHPKIRFELGDIRDYERLCEVFNDIDIVIHTAALKLVSVGEKFPMEYIQTNILGTNNVIKAAIKNKVSKVISISTDKASSAINLYGATKFIADKLFIHASQNNTNTQFSIIRLGNIVGARGSVIPLFNDLKKEDGILPIHNPNMSRFCITNHDLTKAFDFAISNLSGGEILVPKIKSFLLKDLIKCISPNSKIEVTGLQNGEKMHEELIDSLDSLQVFDLGDYYLLLPKEMNNILGGKLMDVDFQYHSNQNEFYTINELQTIVNSVISS